MRSGEFETWLNAERNITSRTIDSRLSTLRRVEHYEGDLDTHYETDGLAGLMERLSPGRPAHSTPINGNTYNGTASLKSAVGLYRDFRDDAQTTARTAYGRPINRSSRGPRPTQIHSVGAPSLSRRLASSRSPSTSASRKPRQRRSTQEAETPWPAWPGPSDQDLLELAQAMTPLVRFLHPSIVYKITEDNRRMSATWCPQFEALGIDAAIYLWDGSPCAFPGVRRYAGSTEIAVFRKRATPDHAPSHCLVLDDNSYPKHLWAFVFTGKPFRNRGPDGYQLAHLLDHKESSNRWGEELDGLPSNEPSAWPPHGLFTSAANSAYVPQTYLRPTDFSAQLRSLIQRRALQLYGDTCCMVPPPLALKPCQDPNWDLANFRWSDPVGDMDRLPAFLDFRRERIADLLDKRSAVVRPSPGEASQPKVDHHIRARGWSDALSYADSALHKTMRTLAEDGFAAPEVGFELPDASGRVLAQAELAWEETRIAVTLDADSTVPFAAAGWRAHVADDPNLAATLARELRSASTNRSLA